MRESINESLTKLLTTLQLDRLCGTVYQGVGSILMFHRVVESVSVGSRGPNRGIEVSVEYLDELLRYVKEAYRVIPLADVPAELSTRNRKPFLAITFDDGYRDNYSLAYPLFQQHDLPFAVYVCTAFPEGTIDLWWYALEEVVWGTDRIGWTDSDGEHQLPAGTQEEKMTAYEALWDRMFHSGYTGLRDQWGGFFRANGIDLASYGDGWSMTWDELATLGADDRVTLGAHTVSHRPLATLDAAAMLREMELSRAILASRIGRAVDHFSYPFGRRAAASAREFEAAKAAGFATATTTRRGNLFPEHADHLHCLPRIDVGRSRTGTAFLRSQLSGLRAVMTGSTRKIVTD